MQQLMRYSVDGTAGDAPIATITMDDGKVNVLSSAMLGDINAALDKAEADADVVVLGGRPGVFSAGFDLPVLRAGGEAAASMLRAGFDLAERLLSFPAPVVIACSGHAIAMGAFLVLSGDYRIGATGSYKITANEVAIGVTLPLAAVEICRQRLSPAYFSRVTIIAEVFAPEQAVQAGFLDRVVDGAELDQAARSTACELAKLDKAAHIATKLRARKATLEALHDAIELDSAAYAAALAR